MIRNGLMTSACLIALMLAASFYGWAMLPQDGLFTAHWRLDGTPDRHVGKGELLLLLPAIAAVVTALCAILPRFGSNRRNLEANSRLYLTGWIGGIGIATLAHIVTVRSAVTGAPPSLDIVLAVVGLFLIALGNLMAKSRPNRLAGIRTPWSLDSSHAWSAANRLAGWGFVLTGIATGLATLTAGLAMTVIVLLTGLAVSVLAATLASYRAWKSDPDHSGSGHR